MNEERSTRRRFLALAGAGALTAVAGCTGDDGQGTQSPTRSPTSTPTGTGSPTATESPSPTDETTDTQTQTKDKPAYKNYHWHGRLFFEIDGDLVDFRQPKYFLKNIDNDDAVYFHFHDDPNNHGPNEWSNEKKVVTPEYALNLIPGIGYERRGGEHVVTYEGTTYDGSASGTEVTVHRETEPVDPTSYEVQHNDNFWVRVQTSEGGTPSPAHSGERVGTLVFDVNNRRLDFSADKYVGGGGSFHFHDDGHRYRWYADGEVTLEAALNAIPQVSYRKNGDEHIVEYRSGDEFDGKYTSVIDELLIRQRTSDVDPTNYTLQAGDIIWVYIHTSGAPDNEH